MPIVKATMVIGKKKCLECKKPMYLHKIKFCSSKCQTRYKSTGSKTNEYKLAKVQRLRVAWLYEKYKNRLMKFKTFCNEINRIV